MWPPPHLPPDEFVTVEVERETRFGDAVREALHLAGADQDGLYYFDGKGPYYDPRLLRDANDPASGLVPFPRVVIGFDGGLLWTWGARDQMTFGDFERGRDGGYVEGDPYGVVLERPMYGDGEIPGWEDLIQWLGAGAVGGGVKWLIDFLRRRAGQYQQRGAITPGPYVDLILVREEWDRSEFCTLFQLPRDEAEKELETLGYEPVDAVGRSRWRVSDDEEKTALRRRILRDFLHHPEE
jgi:hypothetical protein